MPSFNQYAKSFEKEGVYIGGWSLRHVVLPNKVNGVHSLFAFRPGLLTSEKINTDAL